MDKQLVATIIAQIGRLSTSDRINFQFRLRPLTCAQIEPVNASRARAGVPPAAPAR